MQGLDQLLGSSGFDLGSLGAQFGLSPEQMRSAMGSLMPAVVGGFHKQAEAGGPAGVADAATAMDQPDEQSGNDILGGILGNKDVSWQVPDHASGKSGVSSTVLKAMLPNVAAIIARDIAANGSGPATGGLGGMLGSMLGEGNPGGGGLGGLGALLGADPARWTKSSEDYGDEVSPAATAGLPPCSRGATARTSNQGAQKDEAAAAAVGVARKGQRPQRTDRCGAGPRGRCRQGRARCRGFVAEEAGAHVEGRSGCGCRPVGAAGRGDPRPGQRAGGAARRAGQKRSQEAVTRVASIYQRRFA